MKVAIFGCVYSLWVPVRPDALYAPGRMIGGGETAMINVARQLAARGHEVTVYAHTDQDAVYDGVHWVRLRPDGWFREAPEPVDVAIAYDAPAALKAVPAHVRVLENQTNNPELDSEVDIDAYVFKSQWHQDAVIRVTPGIDPERCHVIGNGVDLALYQEPVEKVPGRLLWTSSPDRGLYHALEVFRRLRERLPHITLHIHYDMSKSFDASKWAMDYRTELLWKTKRMIDSTPGVVYGGPLDKLSLAHAQMQGEILLFPEETCRPTEGFCISICFLPDTRVYTATGAVKIQDVQPGMGTITHQGRVRPISQLLSRTVENEPIYQVHASGNLLPLSMTAEHPVYVLRTQHRTFKSVRYHLEAGQQPEWVRARDLTESDFLVVPIVPIQNTRHEIQVTDYVAGCREENGRIFSKYSNHTNQGITYQDVADAADCSYSLASIVLGEYQIKGSKGGDLIRRAAIQDVAGQLGWQAQKNSIPLSITLDWDFGFLAGYYLSEGHIGATHAIDWTSHEKEQHLRDEVQRILARFGLTATEVHYPYHGKGRRIYTCCKPLADLLSALCGQGSRNKHLPLELALTNVEFAKGLITGMYRGDGHQGANAYYYTTCSEEMAHGFRRLLLGFGILAGIKSYINASDALTYSLHIGGRQRIDFANLIGDEVAPAIDKRIGQAFIRYGDMLFVPIHKIEQTTYSGPVYNLEVAEDNSYCVEGFAVHNCESLAARCLPLISDCDALPELWGSVCPMLPLPIDYGAWANAAYDLLLDAVLRRDYVEKAQATVQNYTWERMGAQYDELLTRLYHSKPCPTCGQKMGIKNEAAPLVATAR